MAISQEIRRLIIGVVLALLFVPMIMCVGYLTFREESPAEIRVRERNRKQAQRTSRRNDDDSAARVFAEEFVRQSLKAPSTAKFGPYGSVQVTRMGGGHWTVIGYVDAQNGFGAMLRSDWSVLLEKDGDTWRALSVDVN